MDDGKCIRKSSSAGSLLAAALVSAMGDRSPVHAAHQSDTHHAEPCKAEESRKTQAGKGCMKPKQRGSVSLLSKAASASMASLPFLKRNVKIEATPEEVFSDFTPYGQKYGCHPNDFHFDKDGNMQKADLLSPASLLDALHDIDENDTLECVVACGVRYRQKPELTAHFADLVLVDFCGQIKVLERKGDWVRDEIGWVPLKLKGNALFAKKLNFGMSPCFTKARR